MEILQAFWTVVLNSTVLGMHLGPMKHPWTLFFLMSETRSLHCCQSPINYTLNFLSNFSLVLLLAKSFKWRVNFNWISIKESLWIQFLLVRSVADQISMSELARWEKNETSRTVCCSNLLCVFPLLKWLPCSSVIIYVFGVRHLGWSASQMFTLYFEMTKPKPENFCERHYVLSSLLRQAVLWGIWFGLLLHCRCAMKLLHVKCFESSTLAEVILLQKKGTIGITNEEFDTEQLSKVITPLVSLPPRAVSQDLWHTAC